MTREEKQAGWPMGAAVALFVLIGIHAVRAVRSYEPPTPSTRPIDVNWGPDFPF